MLEKMKEIIAGQLNVNAEDVKPESRFKEDLNADSQRQPPSRMTLVQIPLTYLSLLWLLRMSIP